MPKVSDFSKNKNCILESIFRLSPTLTLQIDQLIYFVYYNFVEDMS